MKITKAYLQRAYPNKILRRYSYRGNVDNEYLSQLPLYLNEMLAYGAALNILKENEDYNALEKIAGLDVYSGFKEMQKKEIEIKVGKSKIHYNNAFHFLNSVKKKAKNLGNLAYNDLKINKILNPKSSNLDLYRRLERADNSLINNYKNVLKFISEGRGRAKNEYPANYDKGLLDILSESNIPLSLNKKPRNLRLF
jgi:hypothetical protein